MSKLFTILSGLSLLCVWELGRYWHFACILAGILIVAELANRVLVAQPFAGMWLSVGCWVVGVAAVIGLATRWLVLPNVHVQ